MYLNSLMKVIIIPLECYKDPNILFFFQILNNLLRNTLGSQPARLLHCPLLQVLWISVPYVEVIVTIDFVLNNAL